MEGDLAGGSARDSARRQREKAQRLAGSAELYERGAEGERRTAELLAELPSDEWTVFHDLRWPGRRYANVDHIVVGRAGVFVIDSKNWSGTVSVTHDVLRQNGRQRETAVAGVAEAALAVNGLTPLLRPDLVHPVLCFVRDDSLTGRARDVLVTSTATLLPMLQSRPAVLTSEEVRHLTLDLDAGIRSATAPVTSAPGPVRRRPVTATPRPRPASRSRRQRQSAGGQLARLAFVVIAILVLLANPGIFSAIGQLLADFMIDTSK